MKISVTTINDSSQDWECLFKLWNEVKDDCSNITFDFSKCKFLRHNAVAFLGGLARHIELRGGQVKFNWNSLPRKIQVNMSQNGFINAFDGGYEPWQGNSIPYREDNCHNPTDIINYLRNDWLGRGWVSVSPLLRDKIITTVAEIYANAFEHGCSEIGIFSCGQHYPQLRKLKLTAIDFGVGIPSNVRAFNGFNNLESSDALKWAFQLGNSTKAEQMNVARGVGLDLLSKFVTMNKGKLEIFSHDGYAIVDKKGERYGVRSTWFEGTLVNITLQCDECYYCLANDLNDEPLF